MATRKVTGSGQSGGLSKAAIWHLVEKRAKIESVIKNKLFAGQQERSNSPGPKKMESARVLAPVKTLRVCGRRARRWRETPRRAHRGTPVGARRARPLRKTFGKESTKSVRGRCPESKPKSKTKSESNDPLSAAPKDNIIYLIYQTLAALQVDCGGLPGPFW